MVALGSGFFVLALIFFIFFSFLLVNKSLSANQLNKLFVTGNSTKSQNEDQISQYNIPDDVRQAIDQAVKTGQPASGIRADGQTFHLPILIYHYVEHVRDRKDTIRMSLDILPETFEKQIKTLQDSGYTFINMSDVADILDNIKPAPPKPVVLTFDDGYEDFYFDVLPILKKYNVKAVAYIVSGFIDRPNYMTSAELTSVAQSGLVEIGAHTAHHLGLASLNENSAKIEINTSKIQLEQKLGVPITAFAYPYGSFNLSTIALVKEAGFRTAASTVAGTTIGNQDRFFAFRIHPGISVGEGLLKELAKQ